MAILIPCADCGAQISSDVTKCPHCEGNPWPTICRFCMKQDKSTTIPGGYHESCKADYRSKTEIQQFACPTCKTELLYEDVRSPQENQYDLRWACRFCGQPMSFSSCGYCGGLVLYGQMHPSCKAPAEKFAIHSKNLVRTAKRQLWETEGRCLECGSSLVTREERLFRGPLSRCGTCGYSW
jgi:hypothetical protein